MCKWHKNMHHLWWVSITWPITIFWSYKHYFQLVKIEALFVSMYMYFAQSINRHLEHTKLAKIMETKGLKILCNVKTWWVSMFTPSKHLLFEYKSLVVKVSENNTRNSPTKINYKLLCDSNVVLGLTCVLPMLELVQSLSKMT
jgi:hypothetical protein